MRAIPFWGNSPFDILEIDCAFSTFSTSGGPGWVRHVIDVCRQAVCHGTSIGRGVVLDHGGEDGVKAAIETTGPWAPVNEQTRLRIAPSCSGIVGCVNTGSIMFQWLPTLASWPQSLSFVPSRMNSWKATKSALLEGLVCCGSPTNLHCKMKPSPASL